MISVVPNSSMISVVPNDGNVFVLKYQVSMRQLFDPKKRFFGSQLEIPKIWVLATDVVVVIKDKQNIF